MVANRANPHRVDSAAASKADKADLLKAVLAEPVRDKAASIPRIWRSAAKRWKRSARRLVRRSWPC